MYGLRPQVFSCASTPAPISKSDASTPNRHTLLIMDRLLRATRRAVEIKQQLQDQQGHYAAHHYVRGDEVTQLHVRWKLRTDQYREAHRHHYGVEVFGFVVVVFGFLCGV